MFLWLLPPSTRFVSQDVVPSVLALYAAAGHWPESSHMLFACADTTEDDVSQLLARCYHPALWQLYGDTQPLYCIVNAHTLRVGVQDALNHMLRSFRIQYPAAPCRLAITAVPANASSILTSLGRLEVVPRLTTSALTAVLATFLPHVEVHVSDASGQGKSKAIAAAIKADARRCHRVLIGGPFRRPAMTALLRPACDADADAAGGGGTSVHLDVHETSREHIDAVLLELLAVGRVYDPRSQLAVFLPRGGKVYVEVANVLDNR